jgi:hypothetical protein
MSALRHIAILLFMGLITGCDADHDFKCPGPGYPSFPNCPTNFLLEVVDVDPNSGQVEVVYPQGLPRDRLPNPPDQARKDHIKIYVRDLKMLADAGRLKKGKVYVFHNGNGSPFFEVFPEGQELFTKRQYN